MDHGFSDPVFSFLWVGRFPGLCNGLLRCGSNLQEEFKLWRGLFFWLSLTHIVMARDNKYHGLYKRVTLKVWS